MEARRVRELVEAVGLSKDNLSHTGRSAVDSLANIANELQLKDTDTSTYVMALANLSLQASTRGSIEAGCEARAEAAEGAVARAGRRQGRLEAVVREVAAMEAQAAEAMTVDQSSLRICADKERQYAAQVAQLQDRLQRIGFGEELGHGPLVVQARTHAALTRDTDELVRKLRSYQDLPADKVGAATMIADRRQRLDQVQKEIEEVCARALEA